MLMNFSKSRLASQDGYTVSPSLQRVESLPDLGDKEASGFFRSFQQWLLSWGFHDVLQIMPWIFSLWNFSGATLTAHNINCWLSQQRIQDKTQIPCVEFLSPLQQSLWFCSCLTSSASSCPPCPASRHSCQGWRVTSVASTAARLSSPALLAFMWHSYKLCPACSFSV